MTQRGAALLEAVMAAAVLGLGLLGAARLTAHAVGTAQQLQHDLQAQALANDTLDCALAQTLPCPSANPVTVQGRVYRIEWQRQATAPHVFDLHVRVRWQLGSDEGADTRELRWHTRASDLPDWAGQ